MTRAIVQFSLPGGDSAGTTATNHLRTHGFRRARRTRVMESPTDVPQADIFSAIRQLLADLEDSEIDHMWIYVDNPRDDPSDQVDIPE